MDKHYIFFDGHCGLCHHTVRFAARKDKEGRLFRFAPLGGETFRALAAGHLQEAVPDSVVLLKANGEIFLRSSAVARTLMELGGGWKLLGRLLQIVPRPLRDWGYDLIARHRHRLVAQATESCPLPSPEFRDRFDP
ncbi:MAG: DUF393 domain-containing protein [Acidobacteria bacterium]|nr:DUF393 domain-containing protein [Acidobacteriota bacterium]